jgi:hypothetical protein
MVNPLVPSFDSSGKVSGLPAPTMPQRITTNDRGEFRVYGLQAGTFYILAITANVLGAIPCLVTLYRQ